ncbi:hypothetical protein [Niabella ginsenosidivorans]|uniref:hypothetical protein n=1 Tax=Niabella ginsenosidivorans TaxID=1176587 RepID=UPI0008FCD1A6|nr:hypothetical protein [Niabella ginsenosidivorans]
MNRQANRTLNISISDTEYNQFGLKKDKLSFGELLKLNLRRSVGLAERYNFSKISMEEISDEVKAVRTNAKNRN